MDCGRFWVWILIFVALLFMAGVLVGAGPVLGVIRLRRRSVKRGLAFLPLAVGNLVLPLAINASGLCIPKSIANLGEFFIYGMIGGLIPIGQFFRVKKLPGELLVASVGLMLVVYIYRTTPALPETPYG